MIYKLKYVLYILVSSISIFSLFIYSLFRIILKHKKTTKIIFGTTPILNNKYWSNALKEIGMDSETFMKTYYSSINKKDDYDKYFEDVIPKVCQRKYIKEVAYLFFVWLYIINNAKIFVMPFSGVVFHKYFWRFEYLLFKLNGIKTIVLPYGADAYMYSRIKDTSLQNVLLINYPDASKNEVSIEKKVFFWSKYCDFIIGGFMACDGMPRWDVPFGNFIQINTAEWQQKKTYSMNDGNKGVVKIMHSPNHRGVKGTEYLIKAIDELKKEGLQVELVLLEKVPNTRVRELMQEVDILAEQFMMIGHGLNAIEGMASGLPVLANLDNEAYTTVFRRYSFLNECPILSTTPETLKDNLRLLITNPKLRKELGELGRKYAEKYHSYEMAQYLFAHIFRKLDGEDIDLMNLFHPLKSEYVKNNYIKTPFVNNRYIPKEEV